MKEITIQQIDIELAKQKKLAKKAQQRLKEAQSELKQIELTDF